MLVRIRDLPVSRVIELTNDQVRDTIAGMPTRAVLECPSDDANAGGAEAKVEVYADDDGNVYARGQLSGWFAVGCSRCIEPVRYQFEESLDATFRPAGTIPGGELEDEAPGKPGGDGSPAELGLELSDEDLDIFSYEGESIDLEPLLREQLILAVPFAPLCREECQGLCPQCGVDKNREQCACEPPIDPRLAALQNIKL